MDIRKEILKAHSLAQTTKIVRYVGDDKTRFSELVKVFLAGPYRVTQRAAWPISHVAEKHPELIGPHLKNFVDLLSKKGNHDAVKRNLLRLLQFVELPDRLHGKIADLCFDYLKDRKEPIAIRVFAMSTLASLAKTYESFGQELQMIIEDEMPIASAAFISRGRKVLKQLRAIPRA